MTSWEINIGLFPGILFGFRQYEDVELEKTDNVLYLGMVDVCFTAYYGEIEK